MPRPWVAVPAFVPAIGRRATCGFMAARACGFDGDATAVDEPLEMRNDVRIECVGSFDGNEGTGMDRKAI